MKFVVHGIMYCHWNIIKAVFALSGYADIMYH